MNKLSVTLTRTMNANYLAFALILVVGVSLVHGQCDKPPAKWKRPEECCKFSLIKESVFESCRSDKNGPQGDNDKEKPPKQGPHHHDKGKMECFVECVFNQTGLYNGKQLNANEIRKTFTAAVSSNPGLLKAVNTAIDVCLPLATNHSVKSPKCKSNAHFVFACITSNLVAQCPPADFQSKDDTCVALQKYFKQCPNGPQHKE